MTCRIMGGRVHSQGTSPVHIGPPMNVKIAMGGVGGRGAMMGRAPIFNQNTKGGGGDIHIWSKYGET